MLLNESQSSTSPSRNSSPDVVVLALANPDTGRPGNRSHPLPPSGVPLLLTTIITIHSSDSSQGNEPLERERAGTTAIEQQGWNPGNTLRDEGTNGGNISDPIMVAARVPPNNGTTATTGDAGRPGLVDGGRPGNPSHEPPIPVPILPIAPPHPVPVGGTNATTMG